MDPITLGAVLIAVLTGASEAVGGQLWAGVSSLVRRPLRGGKGPGSGPSAARSGETELTALQQSPHDQRKAVALAEALLDRAHADTEFERALREWWERAAPVLEKTGSVTNTISGGTFSGPVLQGRDFSNITFGAAPSPPAPRPGDADGR